MILVHNNFGHLIWNALFANYTVEILAKAFSNVIYCAIVIKIISLWSMLTSVQLKQTLCDVVYYIKEIHISYICTLYIKIYKYNTI